ncbi:hypothetical protein [Tropicimonas marinistellae]|uniref:hypothetical protein n=1 Tax=Tropicimonas marinistellae TaxID=1739787 RepID=UPI00082B9334|nr:hypothetical protein [Tropicimonas marinistellae]
MTAQKYTKEQAEIALEEMKRVQEMLRRTTATMNETGGDIEWFASFLLRHAIELHSEIFGSEQLELAITKIGKELLVGDGKAGRA